MNKEEDVIKTLFIPLNARINISRKFPEYFYDGKALELDSNISQELKKGSFEYSNMASVARYYNLDKMVRIFLDNNKIGNVIFIGAGLETAYHRLNENYQDKKIKYYQIDLPEAIEARRSLLGEGKNEILIAGDMFQIVWQKHLDVSIPTLIVVSGVFQYFKEEKVLEFVNGLKNNFIEGELIFDATNEKGLKYANWFVKRTGNKDIKMYFYINDGEEFAKKAAITLLEERTFFEDARKLLAKKLNILTKISMKMADDKKRTMIYRYKL